MNNFRFNIILKKYSNQSLCYLICIVLIGIFILSIYKNRFETIETSSSLVIPRRIIGSQNIETLPLPLQDGESKRTSDYILFKFLPETSHVRAADRMAFININKIDTSKLLRQYKFDGTYTRFDKAPISSKCMSIYPFDEDESYLVEQSNYQVVQLQTPYGNTPIALHGSGDALSDWLRDGASFEPQITEGLISALNTDPLLALFDFGAMLGFYTLHAALSGHFVISVEANIENARRLMKSIILGRLDHRVILFKNALWDESCKKVELQSSSKQDFSIGMISAGSNQSQSKLQTITLNDLLKVVILANIKKAVLKIDIEGSEYEALLSAGQLFDNIDIPIVFMEWLFYSPSFDRPVKHFKRKGEFIKNFFYSRGYKTYTTFSSTIPLTPEDNWPGNVVFKR
jgi:FkbM family methyltransferase